MDDLCWQTLLSSSSSLYCLVLVAIYLVTTTTWLATAEAHHYTEAEVGSLLFYLLFGSCAFLLYLLIWLPRRPFSHPGLRAHAHAFVRNGAAVFGLGTLLLYVLVLIQDLAKAECSSQLAKTNSVLRVVFITLSMLAIIFLPKVSLYVGWGGPHFGLMHLVATHIIGWIRHVLQESLHELHEAQKKAGREHANLENEEDHHPLQEHPRKIREAAKHPLGSVCEEVSLLENIILTLEPVFFAFTIEFVLIGATVFTNMWSAIGEEHEDDGKVVMVPHFRKTLHKTDWTNSLWGFLAGLVLFVLNIASLVAFFTITSAQECSDEYISKVVSTVTNCCGTAAVLVGLRTSRLLVEKVNHEPALMDRFLLKLGVFFVIVFTCFTITVGVFPGTSDDSISDLKRMEKDLPKEVNTDHKGEERVAEVEDIPGELHIIAGVLNLLQVVLQVVFIEVLLTKTIRKGETHHPGRHIVALLAMMNLGLWLVDTFELQKSRASLAEERFYGPIVWVAIQRITLPICIFFRFHSSVVLIDCWKDCYRREEEEEVNERQEAKL